MEIGKIIKHIAKKGDNLKDFKNSSLPVILVIDGGLCLLDDISKDEAKVLYRDSNKEGFPAAAYLKLRDYHIKNLKLEPEFEFVDFSGGRNIRLNEAGIIYNGQDTRLKFIEKIYQEGKVPVI